METTIPICSIHDRFQNRHGEWLAHEEHFSELDNADTQGAYLKESPCDLCEEMNVIDLFGNGSGV